MPAWAWWLDAICVGVGAALALGGGIALMRTRRWREPLHDAAPLNSHADFLSVLAVFVLYAASALCLHALVMQLHEPIRDADAALTPGTSLWHWTRLADMGGQLVACALMLWFLRGTSWPRHPAPTAPAAAWLAKSAHALATLTILRAVSGPPRPPRDPPARIWLVSLATLLALLPIMGAQLQFGRALWHWLYPRDAAPEHVVLEALWHSDWGAIGRLQLFLAAVLVAPLAEELFFRGVVLDAFRRAIGRHWPAIIASAVLFGLIHAQPQDKLPLVTMGIALGYLRVRYDAIWPCFVVHMLWNLRTMAHALLAGA